MVCHLQLVIDGFVIIIHSTDGCPQDTLMPVVLKIGDKTITYNYTWPETDIGAPPVEPCPCISRRCGGSYGSGGSWENVTGTCDASSYSSSTLDLCKAILVIKSNIGYNTQYIADTGLAGKQKSHSCV